MYVVNLFNKYQSIYKQDTNILELTHSFTHGKVSTLISDGVMK